MISAQRTYRLTKAKCHIFAKAATAVRYMFRLEAVAKSSGGQLSAAGLMRERIAGLSSKLRLLTIAPSSSRLFYHR